ncbi:MAG: SUF system NifU family Fe-S cluster assembly protein [Proteobacteria bacterium]|nr:SUF system NifU family Fe-S cluster assembly protein [Pseudomonadota bacterium]
MTAVNELYQQVILDHNQRPRNYKVPEHTTCHALGHNPLCGDKFTVFLEMDGDVIKDIGFQGSGCAISKASASLMTSAVTGMGREDAHALSERFRQMVTGEDIDPDELDKLAVFSGVSEFPARVKCATLAWHTLDAALDNQSEVVSTEEGQEAE